MLLSARLLNNVTNVNSYDTGLQVQFTEGDQLTVYLQLIDLAKDPDARPLTGRRYVPASGSTLQITLKSNDTAKTITKVASNPFSGDLSIWSFPILSSDQIKGTWTLLLTLTEGAVQTRGRIEAGMLVQPFNAAFI